MAEERVVVRWTMDGLRYGGEVQKGTFRLVAARTPNGHAYAFQEKVGPDQWQVIAETSQGVLGMPAWLASFCGLVSHTVEDVFEDGVFSPIDEDISKGEKFDA